MIAIVTDSTSYITRKEAQQLGVHLVPVTYTVDGRPFNELHVDQNGAFEQLIAQGKELRTAQTPLATFLSTFEELLAQGYDILCITLSSRLSGTYSTASMAARELQSERIHLVDSRSVAGGALELVRSAASKIQQGQRVQEIAEALRKEREKIGIAFTVSDMGPLRKSGRLRMARASIGTVLNIRPILRVIDGGVICIGAVRGRYEMLRRLIDEVPDAARRLIVHHIADEKTAYRLVRELQARFPHVPIEVRPGGPVLAIHLGLGVAGIVWTCE